ncbi:hypothetical protein [Peredibacter starrii]|uniref:Uncharacterized protein n=1 Tax=Peredibacter starrii TaxID=28202 RepID=A0AAX4HPH4_9BACT|nr:hypothetical protein [Peredibacter starrii]WPU65141.1 hypothetical protein SOO65_00055 [Peredibacter starrii]
MKNLKLKLLATLFVMNSAMGAVLFNRNDISLVYGPGVQADDMEAFISLDCKTAFENCGNKEISVPVTETHIHVPQVKTLNYNDSISSWNPLFYRTDFWFRAKLNRERSANGLDRGGVGFKIVSKKSMDAVNKPVMITKVEGGFITVDLSTLNNLNEENFINIHLWIGSDPSISRFEPKLIRWTENDGGYRFKLNEIGSGKKLTIPVKDLLIASTNLKVLKLRAYIQDRGVSDTIELPLELDALSKVPVLKLQEVVGKVPEFKY